MSKEKGKETKSKGGERLGKVRGRREEEG